jgi:hypothetical protein
MQYMLRELFDDLEITLTELKRRSGISDVTLISSIMILFVKEERIHDESANKRRV